MARVTIERALDKANSRFELVVLAAYRAHAIDCGSRTVVDKNDKYAVLALREIESGMIDIDELRKIVIEKYALENKTFTSQHSFVSNSFSFDDLVENELNISNEADDVSGNKKRAELNVSSDFFA